MGVKANLFVLKPPRLRIAIQAAALLSQVYVSAVPHAFGSGWGKRLQRRRL